MNADDVRRIVREELDDLLVERVSDLEAIDTGSVRGKGAADQTVQAELAGQYGVQSRPPDGADGIVIRFPGGGGGILIGYRHRQYEIGLDKGEIALVDDQGIKVVIKRNGVVVDASAVATANVKVIAGANGKVQLGGDTSPQPAVLGDNAEARLAALEARWNGSIAHTHAVSGGVAAASVNYGAAITSTPNIRSSKVEVE